MHRQLSVVEHLHKIVICFKKSTLKFTIFEYKIANSRPATGALSHSSKGLQRLGAIPLTPFLFLYYSHTALLQKFTFTVPCF